MVIKRSQIEEWDIGRLSAYENNAKLHPDSHVDQIANSIEEFTFLDPVAVDEKGELLEGHGRLLAAKKRGDKTIPVIQVTGLTEAQKVAYRFTHNKLTMNTGFDPEMLKIDFEFLQDEGFDLDLTGFGELELSFLDEQEEEDTGEGEGGSGEDDFEPPEELESRVKLGEIWQLGRHKIAVNDCADVVSINQLIDNATIDMIFTDPPYGVKRDKGFEGFEGFGGFGEPIKRRRYEDDNWDDSIPDKAIFDFLLGLNAKTFIFGGNFFAHLLPQSTHWIFWDKVQTMPTFGDGELVWTNSNRKSIKKYVFQYNGLLGKEKERYHPTQKPVGIIELIINDYSEQNEIILDPFLGSGTTLIAAEKTGRTCYGCEISLKYATIILERWERLTGQEAKLISPQAKLIGTL